MSAYATDQRLEVAFSLLADPHAIRGPEDPAADTFVYALVEEYKHRLLGRIDKSYPHCDDPHLAVRTQRQIETLRHRFALRCLKDVRSSAALVKEIAFADPPLNADDTFHAADLGTGTGVLAVGEAIAGLRSGARTAVLHMVDTERFLLNAAATSVATLDPRIQCRPQVADITEPSLYRDLPLNDIRFWVTETISQGLPPASLRIVCSGLSAGRTMRRSIPSQK